MNILPFTYEQYTAQVKNYMVAKGVKKAHLANQLGLARVTFDKRLSLHNWKIAELESLAKEGII